MKKSAYFYPPRPKNGYDNPYAPHFKAALGTRYDVAEADNQPVKGQILSLLQHSFRSDVFLLNWIENVGVARKPGLRTWITLFCLNMIRWRRRRIVWVLHNIHPHEGENRHTKRIKNWLFQHADLIVTHSRAAENYAQQHTQVPVVFAHHPVRPIQVEGEEYLPTAPDVFIWGTILPYKGVGEFVSHPLLHASSLKVNILGHCGDKTLTEKINNHCNERVVFDNRRADFREIASYIRSSRYVLFPYTSSGFSSSGALIDTLALGGTPVAPATGCFNDLAAEGLCITYHSYDELFDILHSPSRKIDKEKVKQFMEDNSWEHFIDKIYTNLQ